MEGKTSSEIRNAKLAALDALRNKPTTYYVTVIAPDPLPEKLKGREEIAFTVKPPTFATLTEIALVVERLPEDLFEGQAMSAKALKHLDSIIEMIAILAWGNSRKPVPSWYVPFLKENLTIEESLMIWHESAAKLQTDFFLPFFQIAKAMNPMTMAMRRKKKDTTRSR